MTDERFICTECDEECFSTQKRAQKHAQDEHDATYDDVIHRVGLG